MAEVRELGTVENTIKIKQGGTTRTATQKFSVTRDESAPLLKFSVGDKSLADIRVIEGQHYLRLDKSVVEELADKLDLVGESAFFSIAPIDEKKPVDLSVKEGEFRVQVDSREGRKTYRCRINATGISLEYDGVTTSYTPPKDEAGNPQIIDTQMHSSVVEELLNGDGESIFRLSPAPKSLSRFPAFIMATYLEATSLESAPVELGDYSVYQMNLDGTNYLFAKGKDDKPYLYDGGQFVEIQNFSYRASISESEEVQKPSLVFEHTDRAGKTYYTAIDLKLRKQQLTQKTAAALEKLQGFIGKEPVKPHYKKNAHEIQSNNGFSITADTRDFENTNPINHEVVGRTFRFTLEDEREETETPHPASEETETPPPVSASEEEEPAHDDAPDEETPEELDGAVPPAEAEHASVSEETPFRATPKQLRDVPDVKLNPQWGNAVMTLGLFLMLGAFLLFPALGAVMAAIGSAMVVGGGVFYITADRISNPYIKFKKYLFDPLSEHDRELEDSLGLTYEHEREYSRADAEARSAMDEFVGDGSDGEGGTDGDFAPPAELRDIMMDTMGFSPDEFDAFWAEHGSDFLERYRDIVDKGEMTEEDRDGLFGYFADFSDVDAIDDETKNKIEALGDALFEYDEDASEIDKLKISAGKLAVDTPAHTSAESNPFKETCSILAQEREAGTSLDFDDFCAVENLARRQELVRDLDKYLAEKEAAGDDLSKHAALFGHETAILQIYFRNINQPKFADEQMQKAREALFGEHGINEDLLLRLRKLNQSQEELLAAREQQSQNLVAASGELITRVLSNPQASQEYTTHFVIQNADAIAKHFLYQDFSSAEAESILGALPDEAKKAIEGAIERITNAHEQVLDDNRIVAREQRSLRHTALYAQNLDALETFQAEVEKGETKFYSDKDVENAVAEYIDSQEMKISGQYIDETLLEEAVRGARSITDESADTSRPVHELHEVVTAVERMIDDISVSSIGYSLLSRERALRESGFYKATASKMLAEKEITGAPHLPDSSLKEQIIVYTASIIGGENSVKHATELLEESRLDELEAKLESIPEDKREMLSQCHTAYHNTTYVDSQLSGQLDFMSLADNLNAWARDDRHRVTRTYVDFSSEEFRREKQALFDLYPSLKSSPVGEDIARVVIVARARKEASIDPTTLESVEDQRANFDERNQDAETLINAALSGELGVAIRNTLLRKAHQFVTAEKESERGKSRSEEAPSETPNPQDAAVKLRKAIDGKHRQIELTQGMYRKSADAEDVKYVQEANSPDEMIERYSDKFGGETYQDGTTIRDTIASTREKIAASKGSATATATAEVVVGQRSSELKQFEEFERAATTSIIGEDQYDHLHGREEKTTRTKALDKENKTDKSVRKIDEEIEEKAQAAQVVLPQLRGLADPTKVPDDDLGVRDRQAALQALQEDLKTLGIKIPKQDEQYKKFKAFVDKCEEQINRELQDLQERRQKLIASTPLKHKKRINKDRVDKHAEKLGKVVKVNSAEGEAESPAESAPREEEHATHHESGHEGERE